MSSILTNPSALTALQALRMTQKNLAQTQQQVSTGLKVASAAENASTWSIAKKMTSQQTVLSTISESLTQSEAMLSAASASVSNALSVMNTIKQGVLQAKVPGADTTAILSNLQTLGAQLTSIVSSATINGLNLLDGSQTSTVSFAASYKSNNGASASTIGTIDLTPVNVSTALSSATYTSGVTTNFTSMVSTDIDTATHIANTLSDADKAINDLTSYAASIGASQTRFSLQKQFVAALQDALSNAVSSLVDADMNDASTRIQALQTQQQLGIQSLSIANQNAQAILKLFQ